MSSQSKGPSPEEGREPDDPAINPQERRSSRFRQGRPRRSPSEGQRLGARGLGPEAFTAMFTAEMPVLVTYFQGHCSPDVAEDLASETLFRVWCKREAYDPAKGPLGPWVQGFASKILKTWLRDNRRYNLGIRKVSAALVRSHGSDEVADMVHDRLEADAELAVLHRCLSKLPPKQASILVMRYGHGLKPSQIAEHLEMNLNTVRSYLQRGTRALLRELNRARDPQKDPESPRAKTAPTPAREDGQARRIRSLTCLIHWRVGLLPGAGGAWQWTVFIAKSKKNPGCSATF